MHRRHLVRTALFGAAAIGLAACAAETQTSTQPQNIVEIASGNEDFSTLVAAVTAADLAGTLSGPGPFTVFAPTNAAFAALPPGTVDNLLLPENRDELVAILTYHVVPGQVLSTDVAGSTAAPATVNGATLAVDGTDGVTVNGANVVTPDIIASNGVIHAIDQVLLPD